MCADFFDDVEKKYIMGIENLNLSYEEAKIYFKLIKHGNNGSMARELNEEIPEIERTTIYSILKRLIDYGCVYEKERQESTKVKIFYALRPDEFFNKTILKKERELSKIKKIKKEILFELDRIFNEGFEYSISQIEKEMKPYFIPLIKNGWKIIHKNVKKDIEIFGFKFYDYRLRIPSIKREIYDKAGFILLLFDYDIENDDLSFNFYIKQLKRILIKIHESLEEYIEIVDNKKEFFGKIFPSLLIRFKKKENDECILESDSVIIPIQNKMFFIWSEVQLEEIIKIIIKIEGINK